jgi:hypothetical protein
MLKIKYQGRLGNILMTSVCASIIAKKYDLKVENYNNFNNANFVNLYSGNKVFNDFIELDDFTVLNFVENTTEISKGIILDCFFQDKNFLTKYKTDIKNMFTYNKELRHPDDLFVHVRLGDVAQLNPGYEYYEKCIKNINFKNGFISSDTEDHQIVQQLIKNFNLKIYNNSPLDTIFFGSQFSNLVLSNGTFSWWMGMLSNENNIFYPIVENKWFGEMYFDNWKGIRA